MSILYSFLFIYKLFFQYINNIVEKMNIIFLGYEGKIGYGFIMSSIFFSFVMNIIFIIYYLLKKIMNKTKKKISSFEQILFILSISETLISLIWFISSLIYTNNSLMIEGQKIKTGCKIIGFLQTATYFFDWILSGCAIYHLRNMIINPINFILKPFKKILLYLIISCIISIVITTISICIDSIGISPLISCFLCLDNSVETKTYKNIFIILFIFTPIFLLIFFFVQYCCVKSNPSYKNDSENKRIFDNYYKYSLINLSLTSLIPILFVIDWISGDSIEDNQSELFFILTLIISLNPLFLGILRLYEIGIFKLCCKCKKQNSDDTRKLGSLLNNEDNENELNIETFEVSAVKKFVMNIYISISFCFEKSNLKKIPETFEINQPNCNEINEYTITKSDIMTDPYISKLNTDILVKSREDFNISCVEYAPKIFAHLRKLDSINDEEILKSLLPMNNQAGIKESEGKGGSFFVNSDDNEFSLKTLTYNEAELIRGILLHELAEYLSQNNDSIIGRIYGMYKISNKSGFFKEDELYFILMKNVIGSFNDNLICKYDLKGSSLNRKVDLGEFVQNVMKDNNFKDIEQVLFLNNQNAQKLLNIATKDANFFANMKVMDYSLLVAKISLNKDEIEDLFGRNHRRQSERQYFEMAGMKNKIQQQKEKSGGNNKENNKTDEIGENENENEEDEDNKQKIIRYKKDKLKPLKKYFFPALKGDVLYIIAIIDFLQEYNLNKTLETKFKLLKSGVKEKDISSVPPEKYKDRFIEFVQDITDTENYLKNLTSPLNKNDF